MKNSTFSAALREHRILMILTMALLLTALFILPAGAEVNATPLTLDTDATATISAAGQIAYFSFTPAETGTYIFSSSGNAYSATYGYLYDADLNLIASDSYSGQNNNFQIVRQLTAGTLYYFGAKYYNSSSTGSFTVSLTKDSFAWSLEDGVLTISGPGAMLNYSFGQAPWYASRSSITSVVIGNDVTSIGSYAFYGCSRLTSISIPGSVISIGDGAFYGCSGLASITIPGKVTRIRDYAFYGCSGLTSISIPSSVTSIGYNAFSGCSGLKTAGSIGGGYDYEFGWTSSIPSYAFYNCSGLTSVTIPGSVTSIGYDAFSGCSGLTSVTIPGSVTNIDSDVFSNCSKLSEITVVSNNNSFCSVDGVLFNKTKTSLIRYPAGKTGSSYTIPASVTNINTYAFYGCSGLTSISIPGSVTSIGSYAFSGCSKLETVQYSGTADQWRDISIGSGNDVLILAAGSYGLIRNENVASGSCGTSLTWSLDSAGFLDISGTGAMNNYSYSSSVPWNTLRAWIKNVILPNGVTNIANYAFYDCSNLTSVTIPNSVTSIGYDAFYNCSGLTSVTIPNSVTSIDSYAFSGCSGLKTAGLIGGGYDYEFGWASSIPSNAFYGCSGLTSITIPGSVTSIGYDAFYGCSGLKTAGPIGGGYDYEFGWTSSIPDYAFYNCSGLTSISIPGSVKSIGYKAFYACSGLTSITIPDSVTSIGSVAFSGCSGLTSVTISGGVTSIGSFTFSGCSGLTSVTISGGVTSIGYRAFSGCSGLTSITIPGSVTSIEQDAFYGCSGLKTAGPIGGGYDFEFGWTSSIPSYAFYGCSGLTSVSIPGSVTSIGSDAFYGCSGLTSISIPGSVTSISYYAFYGCSGLKTAGPIGGGYDYEFGWTSSIPDYAFYGCSGLTSVTIPGSVTSIGYDAFYNCSGLKTAGPIGGGYDYEFGWTSSIPSYAFRGCSGLTSISIPSSVTSIGEGAFYNCSGLTSITIPNSVTSIGDYAFYCCSGLTSVTVPPSVIHMGEGVFSGCSLLAGADDFIIVDHVLYDYTGSETSVIIPYGITGISGAFEGRDDLTSITIPDSVISIGSCAFQGCSGLTGITIPDSVTSIGYHAFDGCAFSSITIPASVTSIIGNPFSGCWNLEIITVAPGNSSYCSVNGVLFNKERTELICYPYGKTDTSYVIPNGVTSIRGCTWFVGDQGWSVSARDGAFSCNPYLESVTVPNGVSRISMGTFTGCANLTAVALPKSVRTIELGAFASCGLTGITIPDGVTSIGDYSFSYCESLASVTIPKTVNAIGEGAYDGCGSLSELIYTGTAESWAAVSIGEYNEQLTSAAITFAPALLASGACGSGLTWTLDDDGLLTIQGSGEMDSFTTAPWYAYRTQIREAVVGDHVYSISSSAFADCTNLMKVKIGVMVFEMGTGVFSGCPKLKTAGPVGGGYDIEFYWNAIPDHAFDGCTSLEEVTVPAGSGGNDYSYLGDYAFAGCTSLTKVTLTDWTVVSSGEHVFSGCTKLADEDGLVIIDSMLFDHLGSPTELTISPQAEWIASNAFVDCSSLTSVTVQSGVIGILGSAFGNCSNLSSIILPNTIKYIDSNAFIGCTSLTNVRFSGTQEEWNNIYIREGNECLTSAGITFPAITNSGTISKWGNDLSWALNEDGVLTVSGTGWMEYGDENSMNPPWYSLRAKIKTAVVTEGLKDIGYYAFKDCSRLTSVSIPSTATRIAGEAFYGCASLKTLVIPEGVQEIEWSAFQNCSSLTSIHIPSSVTSIENMVFEGCSSLVSISVDPYNTSYVSENGVLYNHDQTAILIYPAGKKDTSFVIPDGVTDISSYLFEGNSCLTHVSIPDSVNLIGFAAFANCSRLTELVLPDDIISVESGAFRPSYPYDMILHASVGSETARALGKAGYGFYSAGYPKLQLKYQYTNNQLDGLSIVRANQDINSIDFPPDVTIIGDQSFYSCTNLTSVTIPGSVTSIGREAFYGCSSLTKVVIPGSVTSIGNNPFPKAAKVYCYEYSYAESWAEDNGYTVVLLDNTPLSSILTVSMPAAHTVMAGTTSGMGETIFPRIPEVNITWTSSNNTVASVDADGRLTAHRPGTATITLNAGGKTASCTVTVVVGAESFELEPDYYVLAKKTLQAGLIGLSPADAVTELTWSTGDTVYATISAAGLITGKAVGETTLTVTDAVSGLTRTAAIHICYPVSAVTLTPSAETIFVGLPASVTANVTMNTQSCVNRLVTFSSSNTSVAAVDQDGNITALKPGTVTITARAANGISASCTLTVVDHQWSDPIYVWSPENDSVTATRICLDDDSLTYAETVSATGEVTKPATCEEPGETTYISAAFESPAFSVQTKTLVNINALGHWWNDPVYAWAEDNTSVTASHVCARDETHTETETVSVTAEVISPVTCEEDGQTVYTSAGFTNSAFEAQTKTVDYPALGHDWSEPAYTWADDHSSVTASRVCSHDETHTETETVSVTAEVTLPAACTEVGRTTYTSAAFENEAFAVQTMTLSDIEATGHTVVTVPAAEPTCTEPGHTEVSACSVCGTTFSEYTVIDPLGHDGRLVLEIPAGVGAEGFRLYECARCGERYTESIEPLPEPFSLTGRTWTLSALSRNNKPVSESSWGNFGRMELIFSEEGTCTFKVINTSGALVSGTSTWSVDGQQVFVPQINKKVGLNTNAATLTIQEDGTLLMNIYQQTGASQCTFSSGTSGALQPIDETWFGLWQADHLCRVSSGALIPVRYLPSFSPTSVQINEDLTVTVDGASGTWSSNDPYECTAGGVRYVFRVNQEGQLVCRLESGDYAVLIKDGQGALRRSALNLPAQTSEIEAEAFAGIMTEEIAVPNGCVRIGSKAFAGCGKLRLAVLPASVRSIADDAFEGCSLTILAPAGSYAAVWAQNHGFDCLTY